MISYEEEDRPSIEDILKDKWFDELNNKNEEEKKLLEKELNEIIIEREKKVSKKLKENLNYFGEEHSYVGNRSVGEEFNEIFPQNLIPKTKKIDYDIESCIKFK